MLIALCADKGAPGVTTSALALAATWPRPVLLAECDADGCDIPYWLAGPGGTPLSADLGTISLGAHLRSSSATTVTDHIQVTSQQLQVLVGPQSPAQSAALGRGWDLVATALRGVTDRDVIVDCGRVVSERSPAAPILQAADLVLVVMRPTLAGVARLRHGLGVVARILNSGSVAHERSPQERLATLAVLDPDGGLGAKTAVSEVRQVLHSTPGLGQVPVVGLLVGDARAAAMLRGLVPGDAGRSKLLKSAKMLSAQLVSNSAPLQEMAQAQVEASAQAAASLSGPLLTLEIPQVTKTAAGQPIIDLRDGYSSTGQLNNSLAGDRSQLNGSGTGQELS